MRILFVDDEAAHADVVTGLLQTVLDAEIVLATSVQQAVAALLGTAFDLMITDLFIPLGDSPQGVIGPRARRFGQHLDHLGGLVLIDELDRVDPCPPVLLHTASTEHALFVACEDRVCGRIHKPASAEHMLRAVLEALGLPVPR